MSEVENAGNSLGMYDKALHSDKPIKQYKQDN